MQSYMIEISEAQREMIVAALNRFLPNTAGLNTRMIEAAVLRDLLTDLPTIEADDPDVVHALNR